MFGFSWSVIIAAIAIVAIAVYIFDIDWYKAALVVVAVLFVSGLYRDGKLPEVLEPIADRVFFWVDKAVDGAQEAKEAVTVQKEEKDSFWNKKSLFGFRWGIIILAAAIVAFVCFIYDVKWYKAALVAVAILFVSGLYRDNKLPENIEPVANKVFTWTYNLDVEEPYRPNYNRGTCYDLSGSPYVLSIYINDDESTWTPEAAAEFQENVVLPGLVFVNEQAAEWGVSLELSGGMIVTDSSKDISVRYNGTILTMLDGESTPREEILKEASRSLGFRSTEDLYQYVQKLSGEEQVVILLMVNKEGRSHAKSDVFDDDGDDIECSVVFTSNRGWSTVSHELLHMFGAEDLYEEDSTGERAARAAITQKCWPNDVMFDGYRTEVSAYTAYAVGWTHEVPEECIVSEFWEGHWSRS